MRYLIILVPVALTIYAVIDAIQTNVGRVRHLPKLVWILLILVTPPIGAIVWLVTGRQPKPRSGRPRPRRPAPRGPDDDPDFLRNL